MYDEAMKGINQFKISIASYYLPSESKIGVGWASHRLANALVALGQDVTVISPCKKPEDANYKLLNLSLNGRFRTFKWGFKLRDVDWSKFDVLLAQGDDHLIPSRLIPVHIRTFHGSCFDEAIRAKGLFAKLRMLLLGITELISAVRTPIKVGVSRNSLRWFPWASTVIPNGVDVDIFSPPSENEKSKDPTVLFVGTYAGRKRGSLLQTVFTREILPQIPNAQLWMVCSDAPCETGVEVFGKISDEELANLYRKAWVFCLPSEYEGFGIPYIESIASGLYVVATPNLGAVEILQSPALGCITPSNHLGSTLLRIMESKNPPKINSEIIEEYRNKYSIEKVALSYISLIQNHFPKNKSIADMKA